MASGNDSPQHQLIASDDGRITMITATDAIKTLGRGAARTIDCRGRTVLPGFIDAHCHLRATAESLVNLDLSPPKNSRSISDVISEIRSFARKHKPGTWLRVRGYNEFHLAEKRHPTRWDLDKAAPQHPVKLTHRSGHAHVLNSPALKQVGISTNTPDPPAGLIDRDFKTGAPTGILYEMGDYLAQRIPHLDPKALARGVKLANEHLLSKGITSILDASSHNNAYQWNCFHDWKEIGLFSPRVSMLLGSRAFDNYHRNDYRNTLSEKHICLSGVKVILDETTGRLSPPQEELNRLVFDIHQAGFQVAIHAIEPHAVESACTAIERALRMLPRPDHRHRIEHCSVCPPALTERIFAAGIFIVTQPAFVFYNGDRYLQTVSAGQQDYLYPINTLLKNGIRVAAGSDSPVVPADPLTGVYAAVSRRTISGKNVLSSEKITLAQALDLYTRHAALASFQEMIKGSIAPGMLADFVILNADPSKLSSEEIKDLKVEMTIIDGKVVWENH
jgi:predicted amidohydrolase YtcJ